MNEPTRRAALISALEFGRHLVELAPQPPSSVGTIERPGDQIATHLHFASADALRAFAVAVGLEVAEAEQNDLVVDGDCDGCDVYATARTYVESPAAAMAEQLLVNADVLAAEAPSIDVVNVRLQPATVVGWLAWLAAYDAQTVGPVNDGADLVAVGVWSGITVNITGVGVGAITADAEAAQADAEAGQ
jgi:hypothetical protein